MKRPLLLFAVALAAAACAPPLRDYLEYGPDPARSARGYVDYLKQTRYSHGELDDFPRDAILLHDAKPERFFLELGIAGATSRALELGMSAPDRIWVFRPAQRPAFAVACATPGAGGTNTQAAELAALGAQRIVHVGTCGLLGPRLEPGVPIVASAAIRDGAAIMLSRDMPEDVGRLARPDAKLSDALAARLGPRCVRATGYTLPIYYFQSPGLMRALIRREVFAKEAPDYVEVEEAVFFETCRLAGVAAASVVSGSDRLVLKAGGVDQEFYEVDQHAAKLAILRAALDAFAE